MRPAAHVCAASGASRQDEHALSVSYRSLEAELAHRAATVGAIQTWPPPPSGAPVPHPTSTGGAASTRRLGVIEVGGRAIRVGKRLMN